MSKISASDTNAQQNLIFINSKKAHTVSKNAHSESIEPIKTQATSFKKNMWLSGMVEKISETLKTEKEHAPQKINNLRQLYLQGKLPIQDSSQRNLLCDDLADLLLK